MSLKLRIVLGQYPSGGEDFGYMSFRPIMVGDSFCQCISFCHWPGSEWNRNPVRSPSDLKTTKLFALRLASLTQDKVRWSLSVSFSVRSPSLSPINKPPDPFLCLSSSLNRISKAPFFSNKKKGEAPVWSGEGLWYSKKESTLRLRSKVSWLRKAQVMKSLSH